MPASSALKVKSSVAVPAGIIFRYRHPWTVYLFYNAFVICVGEGICFRQWRGNILFGGAIVPYHHGECRPASL